MLGEIEIAPRRWGPGPGIHVKLGSASSARLTLPEEPRYLYRRTPSTKSDGRSRSSMNFRKVRFGSTLDATTLAAISSPFSRTTPVARPFFVRMRLTDASVRISTPYSRAAAAIAFETAPVPPRDNPHDLKAPSISPMYWWGRREDAPGGR